MFVYKHFIKKAQFDAGFAHRFILNDGAVPAIKDPSHDSELQMLSEKSSSLFSSAHGAPPGALLFSERIVKVVPLFY